MLVVQSGKGISYHKMDIDGYIASTKMLVTQNNLNHGIAMSPDGKTLYASTMTQAYSCHMMPPLQLSGPGPQLSLACSTLART
jgi:hypothetical protein